MRTVSLLSMFILSLGLWGCGDVFYFAKLGWHQGLIAHDCIHVDHLLRDPQTDPRVMEKIRLVQEVKRFGEDRIGLRRTDNYSIFYEVDGAVLYIVTASEKDRLELVSWNFPVIGKVTYKGFFTKEDVLKEQGLLEQKGYDTFVQAVPAYSTLGWWRDPIFSSMTTWRPSALANLILHEMTHATLYFRGKTDFNEQLATFIGNRGAIDFLTWKHGPGTREVIEAIESQEDDALLSRWIAQACERLSLFYERKMPREEKLKEREAVFQSLRDDFRVVKAGLKTGECFDFETLPLNNAVFLAYQRYVHRLDRFESLYEGLGRDLKEVVRFFKGLEPSNADPAAVLDLWLREKEARVP